MSSAARQAWVTGLGVVSPIGTGISRFWPALIEGRVGTGPARLFDTAGLSSDRVGEVKDCDPQAAFRTHAGEPVGRAAQLAMTAVREALQDAGLVDDELGRLGSRAACIMGVGVGPRSELEDRVRHWLSEGKPVRRAQLTDAALPTVAGAIASELGLCGEVVSVSTACAAANHAVGYARDLITSGEADVVIAGGADTLSRVMASLFTTFRSLSPDVVRPFDADRRGIILSEGAGVLVLEAAEHARARGAHAHGVVLGHGSHTDAHDMVDPHPKGTGAMLSMRAALADAGLEAGDVGYISAHGTGTQANDRVEAHAIREVFGGHTDGLPVSSIKSMLGHLQGAAGALESIACLLALREQIVPATVNFERPDTECPVDVVPNQARRHRLSFAMNNAFGFGGACSVLVFGGIG